MNDFAFLLLSEPDAPRKANSSDCVIRHGSHIDFGYIHKTWLRVWRSHFPRDVNDALFSEYHRHIFNRILANSKVYIATIEEDESMVLGYLVARKDVLHWVWVRSAFRRMGIANALMDAYLREAGKPRYASHWTQSGEHFVKKLGLKFNPFLI